MRRLPEAPASRHESNAILKDLLDPTELRTILESVATLAGRCCIALSPEGHELAASLPCARHRTGRGALVSVPVLLRGEQVGLAAVCRPAGSAVADHLAARLAERARIELELRSLSQELVDRYEELTLLYDLGVELTANFDPGAIAEAALRRALAAVDAGRGGLFLTDDGHAFRLAAATGLTGASTGRIWPHLLRRGRPLLIESLDRLPADIVEFWSAADLAPFPSEPMVAASLVHRGQALGVIAVAGKADGGRFQAGDRKLLTAIAHQTALALTNARLAGEIQRTETLRRDLQTAEQVQQSLLPASPPIVPGVRLAARQIPATTVGGDYYDFFPTADGRLALVIADVSGHGVGAALMMAAARSTLRARLHDGAAPGEALAHANRMLAADLDRAEQFLSAFLALYDPADRVLRFASAGHNPPLLAGAGRCRRLESTGPLLGVLDQAEFGEVEVRLSPGDLLLLYTDGVVERESVAGDRYGTGRLLDVLARAHGLPAEAILTAVLDDLEAFGVPERQDDVTLLVLKVQG